MKYYYIIGIVILALFTGLALDKTSEGAEKKEKPPIVKPKGGYTVEELYTKKEELKGKKVTVRGKVVKFNSNIMGKNWLHLQDGSGKEGTNDLTVTSTQAAEVGSTVTATGVLVTDKNIGAGHKYEVILEEANITLEK